MGTKPAVAHPNEEVFTHAIGTMAENRQSDPPTYSPERDKSGEIARGPGRFARANIKTDLMEPARIIRAPMAFD